MVVASPWERSVMPTPLLYVWKVVDAKAFEVRGLLRVVWSILSKLVETISVSSSESLLLIGGCTSRFKGGRAERLDVEGMGAEVGGMGAEVGGMGVEVGGMGADVLLDPAEGEAIGMIYMLLAKGTVRSLVLLAWMHNLSKSFPRVMGDSRTDVYTPESGIEQISPLAL